MKAPRSPRLREPGKLSTKVSPKLSLKGRALKYLAAREHSRVELRRKLGPHAESPEQLDAALDELEARGLLSAERFAESMVHRKAARFGAARIQAELAQHRLPADIAQAAVRALRDSDLARAHALWARRYGQVGTEPQELARQMRFLTARGFAADAVRRVVRGEGFDLCPLDDDTAADPDDCGPLAPGDN